MKHLEGIDSRDEVIRALTYVVDEISRCGITDTATPTYVVEIIADSISAACERLREE